MKRIYDQILHWHLSNDQQMLFLAGPRQVGKTTLSKATANLTDRFIYLNWDRTSHRQIIMDGVDKVAEFAKLSEPCEKKPIIVFDEIHKYQRHWKNFLKGFYDTYKGEVHIIVTGSAKLDIFSKGSDSLMGRYFLYRVHPISVAECLGREIDDQLIHEPKKIEQEIFDSLWQYGGFPEPYVKKNMRFYNRWIVMRTRRLFDEEIRTLSQIHEIEQMEVFAELIKLQVGGLLNRTDYAKKVKVALTTITRWLATLKRFYYIFSVKPWTKNVNRSLLKEPKIYLWDWSQIEENGQRAENFIACHLLKAVQYWQDTGLGEFGLYFVRNKEKQEVDFLVCKNNKPWFLVEVKLSDNRGINEPLRMFHEQLGTSHAFQVVINKPYVNVDCFSFSKPIIVSAKTFLSQLI